MRTSVAFLVYAAATANAQNIEVLTEPRAMSLVVLKIEVNDLSNEESIYVELKGPSDTDYYPLRLFPTDYSEIGGKRFTGPVDGKRTLIVPAFLQHLKTWDHAKHVFEGDGVYSLRLKVYGLAARGLSPEELILFETQVVFTEPERADLKYCEMAGQESFWSKLYHDKAHMELFAETKRTLIGPAVVQQIVHSTRRERNPGHGKSEWADPLYELAFAVPESSYAPYLAYYAACSYMWQRKAGFIKRTYGYELPDKRIADLDYYKKARRSLEFAVERGDPYIKPFAMSFLACMKAWAADFAGADELIRRVSKEPNTPKQIPELVDQLDAYTEKLRSYDGP